MLANALIGLREGLEASLVVSILIAFLVQTERRRELPRVWLGVVIAVAVSVGVTLALTLTEQALTFGAQEIFGGSLSIVSVGFVTWMIFWMRGAARSIGGELRGGLEKAIAMGPVAVVVMSTLAVGREGLETSVFFFSAVQAAGSTTEPLIGFLIGIAISVVLAYLLYRGALRLNLGRFFTVTGVLLVFVAAGILGYGVHDLQEAGVLPGLRTLAFDLSTVMPETSWYGALLKGVFNYSAQTTVLQAVVWAVYVVVVLTVFLRPVRPGVLASAVAAVLLTGCTSTAAPVGAPGQPGPIAVSAGDTACGLSATEAPAGTISFAVNNTGTKVTEFYVYAAGDRIVGEVENVGPGTTRTLTTEVPQGGIYTTACKPGMVGDGIRAPFTVTGDAAPAAQGDAALASAVSGYTRYVNSQVEAQVTTTGQFADAVKRGDVAAAKALYPTARTYWERIEPVAESFGDIDPRIDSREDDQRDPGVAWTGYHRLEKDLWVTGLQPDSAALADRLVADVNDLRTRVSTVVLTPLQMANGAKELLDEVATGKITGEEDRYSHTDLFDFRANVDGSQAAISALRPVLDARDPVLGQTLDARFAAVDRLLEKYRSGDGFVLYTALTPDDTRTMTETVDALAEPVSQVAGVVAG